MAEHQLSRGTSVVDRQAHNLEAGGSSPSPATIYITNPMNSSPTKGTFHSRCRIEDAIEEGRDPETDPEIQLVLEREQVWNDRTKELESDSKWQKNNLEYDLRNTKWICDKAKARDDYAQNIYAALCNQDWQKNDVWPMLKGETYSCSWRYAGGIVADMVEAGDYIDWYCSGIKGDLTEIQIAEAKEKGMDIVHYVGEGHVTDEIREDFFKLGWIPVVQVDDE